MADFFDRLKDKIDGGIGALSAKSQGAMELSRLRNQFRTLEKEKDDRLKELGHTVYDMSRLDNYNPQTVTDLCRKIGEMDRQMVLVQEEIQKVQALMNQPVQEVIVGVCDCGAGLLAQQKFCGSCGRDVSGITNQPVPSAQEIKACISCGSAIKTAARFCGKCGARQ